MLTQDDKKYLDKLFDKKIGVVDKKIEMVDKKIGVVDKKINTLSKDVVDLFIATNTVIEKLDNKLSDKIDKVNENLSEKIDKISEHLSDDFDSIKNLEKRTEKLEEKVFSISA